MEKDLQNYDKLKEKGKKIYTLSSILALLEWDQQTQMPVDGAPFRADQIELLSALTHREKTTASFKKTLGKLIDLETGNIFSHSLDERKKNCLKEFRKAFLRETKLPVT